MRFLKLFLTILITFGIFSCASVSPPKGTEKEAPQPSSGELATAATGEISDRIYNLPEHGAIKFEIPVTWGDEVRQPSGVSPPEIEFRPKKGSLFQVFVTPMWPKRPGVPPHSAEEMKAFMEKEAAKRKSILSLKKTSDVMEMKGSAGIGYYFSGIDYVTVGPLDFKHITQGIIQVGELSVIFTILTNDGQEDIRANAMNLIKSGVHLNNAISKAGSGADVEDLHALVIKTYSFSPRKLDKGKIYEKSAELDSFRKLVESNQEIALPRLREELKRGDNPSAFYWDGSGLLLRLSTDRRDKQLAISAIARSDLLDVDTLVYIEVMNKFAQEGIETTEAAFRVLDYPGFEVSLPAHAITLDMELSLIFMLSPLPENVFIEKAIVRLEKEKNVEAKKALLGLLFSTVTPVGDEILEKAAKDERESQDVRDCATKFINIKEQMTNLSNSDIDPIIKEIIFINQIDKFRVKLLDMQGQATRTKDDIEDIEILLSFLSQRSYEQFKEAASNMKISKEVREFSDSILNDVRIGMATPESMFLQDSILELKKKRRNVLSELSDEAFEEFGLYTTLIRWKQAK